MKSKMYSVAIRRRCYETDHFWNHSDFQFVECKIDTINGRYWYADPFVFEKDNIVYIFFEAFDLVENRGKEGYVILNEDGSCSPPTFVIDEKYHLSFPYVFEEHDNIYMMPEMSGDNSLKLYIASSFPDNWEKIETLLPDVYACDSIFIEKDSVRYLLTNEMFRNVPNGTYASCFVKNYIYKMDGLTVTDHGMWVKEGDNGIRNAGKSFEENGRLYRMGQDCRGKLYGRGLVLFEINSIYPYKETEISRWGCEDFCNHIKTDDTKDFVGIHTYNFSKQFEIIDFSYYKEWKKNVVIKNKWNHMKKDLSRITRAFKRFI